jgi:hypothetical protein
MNMDDDAKFYIEEMGKRIKAELVIEMKTYEHNLDLIVRKAVCEEIFGVSSPTDEQRRVFRSAVSLTRSLHDKVTGGVWVVFGIMGISIVVATIEPVLTFLKKMLH